MFICILYVHIFSVTIIRSIEEKSKLSYKLKSNDSKNNHINFQLFDNNYN